jgi:multidrug efflux pump subunit AcrA (membrane-fusion protein)
MWSGLVLAAPTPPEAASPKPSVVVETVKSKPIYDVLIYPSRISSRINASLLAENEGIVKKILSPLGSQVRKSQRLFMVKHTDPILDYAPSYVTAPVDGVISSLEVTEGSRVVKGQKLATLTDPKQLILQIEVATSDLSAIVAGLEGELKVPGEEKSIPIVVQGVSPYVDPSTGTASAELHFKNSLDSAKLNPGQVGRAQFKVKEHSGIEIPENALVFKGKEPFLRVVEADGKAKLISVTLGTLRQGKIEIQKGLSEGSKVVIKSNSFISEGESVKIENGEG